MTQDWPVPFTALQIQVIHLCQVLVSWDNCVQLNDWFCNVLKGRPTHNFILIIKTFNIFYSFHTCLVSKWVEHMSVSPAVLSFKLYCVVSIISKPVHSVDSQLVNNTDWT